MKKALAVIVVVMAFALMILLNNDIMLKTTPLPTMTPVPWLQVREALAVPDATALPEYEGPSHASKYSGVKDVKLTAVNYGYGDAFTTLYEMEDTHYLIRYPEQESEYIRQSMQTGAIKIKQLVQNHPDVKFYVYYVTRATDMNWYGTKNNIYGVNYSEYVKELLSSEPRIKFDEFDLPDFEYFMNTGYKTDFHINHRGSYKIYQDVYAMISQDFNLSPAHTPVAELDFGGLDFIGDLFSKEVMETGVTLTDDEVDKFAVYKFDLGEYRTFIGDKELTIGQEAEYEAGQIQRDPRAGHQFIYYGGQMDVVRFEFDKPSAPNLLMISDSQGRPSRKPLASHFNTTVFYDDKHWRDLNIDDAINDNDIDAVLIIGQIGMFEIY